MARTGWWGEEVVGKNSSALDAKVGDKIGGFTILRSEYVGKNRTWICLCKCGAEKRFWRLSAVSQQKTCGCGIDEAGLSAKQRRSILSRMQGYKSGAKNRGFEWAISYVEFVEVSTGNCFYCNGAPKKWDCVSNAPSIQKDSPNANPKDYEIEFNGVDRLNSDIGYVSENVVPCCTRCNRAKSDMTLNDFRDHVKRMHAWLFPEE